MRLNRGILGEGRRQFRPGDIAILASRRVGSCRESRCLPLSFLRGHVLRGSFRCPVIGSMRSAKSGPTAQRGRGRNALELGPPRIDAELDCDARLTSSLRSPAVLPPNRSDTDLREGSVEPAAFSLGKRESGLANTEGEPNHAGMSPWAISFLAACPGHVAITITCFGPSRPVVSIVAPGSYRRMSERETRGNWRDR